MEIKVGHLVYSVKEDVSLIAKELDGLTDHASTQITLSPLLSSGQSKTTLLHEIMHACCNFAGIEDDATMTEESFILHLSPILLTVLRENPKLLETLQ